MKIITLKEQEFDRFASSHRYKNYYQTSSYGKLMSKHGFKIHYIGITDDLNHLIGASLLLYSVVFMNKKIAYAPGGILFDYGNVANVEELVKKLKHVLGKQDFILLRMDPYIPATIRNKRGLVSNLNNSVNNILSNIKHAGFKYKGQNNYFENERGRFESVILLNGRSIKDVYLGFTKRTRHKINKASNSGIIIVEDDKKNPTYLQNMITTNKQSVEYYNDFVKEYGDKANVYYAVLDTNAFVASTKKTYEHEVEKNEELTKKIQDNIGKVKQSLINAKMESDKLLNLYKNNLVLATKLLKENPKGLIIGGGLTIIYDNAAYLIIEGFDKNFTFTNPNYLLKWEMIKTYRERNLKYLNLNAITGNFEKNNKYKGLNDMKLGYKSLIMEYIGEYDIVLNSFMYSIYKKVNKEKK